MSQTSRTQLTDRIVARRSIEKFIEANCYRVEFGSSFLLFVHFHRTILFTFFLVLSFQIVPGASVSGAQKWHRLKLSPELGSAGS